MMNALLESLLVPEGATYTYFHRRLDEGIPFNWHYHREIELTLTLNSEGQRYVGESIDSYADGDLALLGPNLPHTWMSQRKLDGGLPHIAHVFWIKADWLDALVETLIELRPLRVTLANATRGTIFSENASNAVRALVANMDAISPARRLIRLIEILTVLAEDREFRLLCVPREKRADLSPTDLPRIERALAHIHKNYESCTISMTQLAEVAALSVSGLHRLFKRHTRQTVNEYVSQLKIGKACSLLISTGMPISRIADQVGYENLSPFNRQFREIKGMTPREFRRLFAKLESDGASAADPQRALARALECRDEHRAPRVNRHPTGLAAIANSDL
jgi:AraC-like DNA-binding protein